METTAPISFQPSSIRVLELSELQSRIRVAAVAAERHTLLLQHLAHVAEARFASDAHREPALRVCMPLLTRALDLREPDLLAALALVQPVHAAL
ncbi:MAG: hypothetical protein ACO32I_07800 [Candidatus Limnocylindrus sp.]